VRYTLLIYETAADFAARTNPAAREGYWAAYIAYAQKLQDAGVMVGGTPLYPPDIATTVRVTGDRREVQDGPFADSKEQLGGYVVIDVADLDAALHWAARCPGARSGAVEVRPDYPVPGATPSEARG